MPARHQLLERGLVDGKRRHGQADHQQVDVFHLHRAHRPTRQRQVLGRLDVAVVNLGGMESVAGEHDIRPDLVEDTLDGNREGAPTLRAQRCRWVTQAEAGQ